MKITANEKRFTLNFKFRAGVSLTLNYKQLCEKKRANKNKVLSALGGETIYQTRLTINCNWFALTRSICKKRLFVSVNLLKLSKENLVRYIKLPFRNCCRGLIRYTAFSSNKLSKLKMTV